MQPNTGLTRMERQLLIAAAQCGQGPGASLSLANTARVIRQAAISMGLSEADLARGMEGPDWHPVVGELFACMVRMVQVSALCDAGGPLFEGGGNWGDAKRPASWPLYTSCRLTERGERLAQEVLTESSGNRRP